MDQHWLMEVSNVLPMRLFHAMAIMGQFTRGGFSGESAKEIVLILRKIEEVLVINRISVRLIPYNEQVGPRPVLCMEARIYGVRTRSSGI
jgi:hypothetical protein